MNEVKDKSNSMFTGKSVYVIVAVDRTEKSQRQFNIAPQQFIVPQTKRHNYHGSWKLWSWAVGEYHSLNTIMNGTSQLDTKQCIKHTLICFTPNILTN